MDDSASQGNKNTAQNDHTVDLDGRTGAWRRSFAAGIWQAFNGDDDAREFCQRASPTLDSQARHKLAFELTLAAFSTESPEKHHTRLDRMLDILSEQERNQILLELVAYTEAEERNRAADYIAQTKHTTGPNRLTTRLAIALMLDPDHKFVSQVSKDLAEALENQRTPLNPALDKIIRDTATEVAKRQHPRNAKR